MSIFRVQHQKNYTVINNSICNDDRLSYRAKGIWMYAFSRPDDWTFHLNDLINKSTDGRDSVQAGLKELEKFGYLKRIQNKDDNHKFQKVEWEFFEVSQVNDEELKKRLPQTAFPLTAFPLTENPPLLSTKKLSTEKTIVCSEAPLVADSLLEKAKVVEDSKNKIPDKCKIRNPMGVESTISLQDVFSLAVKNKMPWSAQEINESWKVLFNYKGEIRDVLLFLTGTIKNLNIKNNAKNYNKTKKAEKYKSPKSKVNMEEPSSDTPWKKTPLSPEFLKTLADFGLN